MTEKLVRNTLWLSAPFNLVAAYLLLMPHSTLGEIVGLPENVPLLYRALLSLVIGIFGGIYAWLATRSPIDNPVLAIGALGKLGVFTTIFVLWLIGQASGGITLLATGDLIFATIWSTWLLHSPKRN